MTAPLAQRSAGSAVAVHVLNARAVAAYGWPDGKVFVTRGLLDRASDDELAAAVAHELGHMLADGHRRREGLATLARDGEGAADSELAELEADAIGMELLASAGLPPEAMVSLLRKVQNGHAGSAAVQRELDRRIAAAQLRTSAPKRSE